MNRFPQSQSQTQRRESARSTVTTEPWRSPGAINL